MRPTDPGGGRLMHIEMEKDEGKKLADLFDRTFRRLKARAIEGGGDYNQQDFARDLGMNYKTVNRILLARELYTEQLATLKALSRLIGRQAVLDALGWAENPTERETAELLAGLFPMAANEKPADVNGGFLPLPEADYQEE